MKYIQKLKALTGRSPHFTLNMYVKHTEVKSVTTKLRIFSAVPLYILCIELKVPFRHISKLRDQFITKTNFKKVAFTNKRAVIAVKYIWDKRAGVKKKRFKERFHSFKNDNYNSQSQHILEKKTTIHSEKWKIPCML